MCMQLANSFFNANPPPLLIRLHSGKVVYDGKIAIAIGGAVGAAGLFQNCEIWGGLGCGMHVHWGSKPKIVNCRFDFYLKIAPPCKGGSTF